MVTVKERVTMERYLLTFNGQWRVITEAEQADRENGGRPFFGCDLCHSHGSMVRLMDRIGNNNEKREAEFTRFEPYLCDPHARELGILW